MTDWKTILEEYGVLIDKLHYRPSVIICGGEPLVSPFLWPLLDFISAKFPLVPITILTNGTLITDTVIEKLGVYENVSFQVSLDGPDSIRHDSIRGNGNFLRALEGIRKLRSTGHSVKVLAVLSKKTSAWLGDFFSLAKEEKFDAMNFVRFVPEGYGRKLLEAKSDQPLLGLELRDALKGIIRLMAKHGVKSHVQGPLYHLLMPGLGRNARFWESIVIDYQGYLLASSRSRIRLGHVLHEGLESVFLHNEMMKKLRARKVDGCGQCDHFAVCGGDRNAAFSATGDFLAKDPGCWIGSENKTINGGST